MPADAPRLLLVDDARFDAHAAGAYHPERPERLVAARAAVAKAQVHWERVPAREATDEELARAHTPAGFDGLAGRGQTGRWGQAGTDTRTHQPTGGHRLTDGRTDTDGQTRTDRQVGLYRDRHTDTD